MRFSIWPGAGNSWSDTLALARHAEATGWDGVWYADHFMPNAEDTSGPTNEAMTTVAALAAAVPRVRLGTLVAGNTYRHPAVLAKMAAGIDIVSGGRFVLGLGAGWQENEHAAYGIPFSTVGGRLSRLDEACRVIKGLFGAPQTDFAGRYYSLKAAPLEPKPIQSPLPLLIGGGGEKRTLRIAAEHADEWNVWGSPTVLRHKISVLEKHCADVGRDPEAIQHSAQNLLFLSDDPEILARAARVGERALAGNVDQIQQQMGEYRDAGVDEFIVPDFTLGRTVAEKIEVLDRFIGDVATPFR